MADNLALGSIFRNCPTVVPTLDCPYIAMVHIQVKNITVIILYIVFILLPMVI